MCWLAKICDIIFGCFQNSLGRVFTIGGETYIVCCLCGTKFPYSLDTMSVHSDETKTPARGLLILGLSIAMREAERAGKPQAILGSKGNRHLHCGPAPRFAIERKCPVQLKHPLSHIDQPHASRISDLVGGATNPIIGHGKQNEAVGPA